MLFNTVIIFAACFTVLFAIPVQYHDCGSVASTVIGVDIQPCPKDGPACILKKGTNPMVSVTFKPNGKVSGITSSVHGIIAGSKVPFPLPNSDGCKQSGIACPVSAGSTVTYSVALPVKRIYPDLKLIVEWELKDQNNKDLVCFTFPVEISG